MFVGVMNLFMNVYWACLSVTLAIALSRGGRPEQVACLILLVAAAASVAAAPDPTTSFRSVEWDMLAVDITGFLAFVALSTRANRYWPMCIAGLRLIPVCSHVAKAVQPEIAGGPYMYVTGAFGYLYMAVLTIGVARHQQRLHRHGRDDAWR